MSEADAGAPAVLEWNTALEELVSADPTLGPEAYFDQLSRQFPDVTKHQVKHKVKRIRERGRKQEDAVVSTAVETKPQSPSESVTGPGFLFYGDPLSDHGRATTPIPMERCVLPETAYEVRKSPIGGLGIFAKQRILSGDFVVLERAIMSIKLPEAEAGIPRKQILPQCQEMVSEAFQKLREENVQAAEAMMELTDCFQDRDDDAKSPAGIFLTNAILGAASTCSGIFRDAEHALCLRISRFNHSCSPNAQYQHDAERDQHSVRAERNIEPGQEICVHYFKFDSERSGILSAPALDPCKKRKELMRISFESECRCQVCSADATAVAESDARRAEIRGAVMKMGLLLQGTEEGLAHEALQLAQEEGLMFLPLVRLLAEVGWSVCRRTPGYHRRFFWTKTMYEVWRFRFGENGKAVPDLKEEAIAAAEASIDLGASSGKGKTAGGNKK